MLTSTTCCAGRCGPASTWPSGPRSRPSLPGWTRGPRCRRRWPPRSASKRLLGGEAKMGKPIRRVGVIGAGVMGSGIAAHLANAGVHAILLYIVPPNLTDAERADRAARTRFAAGGVEKALKRPPAAFSHPSFARLVEVGNTEDDLAKL